MKFDNLDQEIDALEKANNLYHVILAVFNRPDCDVFKSQSDHIKYNESTQSIEIWMSLGGLDIHFAELYNKEYGRSYDIDNFKKLQNKLVEIVKHYFPNSDIIINAMFLEII